MMYFMNLMYLISVNFEIELYVLGGRGCYDFWIRLKLIFVLFLLNLNEMDVLF